MTGFGGIDAQAGFGAHVGSLDGSLDGVVGDPAIDIDELYSLYADCELCPRACHANRLAGKLGFCGADAYPRVARAALHYWEEPPISGDNGSGTVFFAHCQLQCVYCQNAEISRARIDPAGKSWVAQPISAERLAEVFLDLEGQGANNVNLVSATQYAPTVVDAVLRARAAGLDIPIVFNTGGYESVKTLRMLSGIVDIYLTDLKHMDPASALRYAHAPDYPQVALAALAEMVAQTGTPVYVEHATGETAMVSGTIVRHLLLPGGIDEAQAVVSHLAREYGDRVVVSLMSQYVPLVDAERYPEIARAVSADEYDDLVGFACDFDFDECFIQELQSASEAYIPEFNGL